MDIIEFFERTDHRNLKCNISHLVKQKLNEFVEELKERRERLRQLIDSENQKYEQELSSLQQICKNDEAAKRLEWIGLLRLDRERNTEDLLQLKKEQRELDCSEEFKHIRSREMLLDSKQAQLYQIEEKKVLEQKQSRIESFWLDTMDKFYKEKELMEYKEHKLRKCIADVDQKKNLEQNKARRVQNQTEAEMLRRHFEDDNTRATNIDNKARSDAEFYEWRKKVHYKDVLKRQINENSINNAIELQTSRVMANLERKQVQQVILEEIDKKGASMVQNRALQKKYLEHTSNEKKSLYDMAAAFDEALLGTGCVLEQKEKRPYSKNTR